VPNPTGSPTTVTMNSDKSVTAVFIPASIPAVTQVNFTSDYHFMSDETETFAGEGTPYTEPTWDPSIGHNNPICQTKDTPLTAEVTLTLPPCVGGFKLEGKFSDTIMLTKTVEIPTQTVTVESNTNLPNGFEQYNQAITWTLTTDHGTVFNMGTSGPHEIFVTWGPSMNYTPTLKRLSYLFNYVNGHYPSGTKYIAERVATAVNDETAFGQYDTQSDIWLCMDQSDIYRIDCAASAYLATFCLSILGWPNDLHEVIESCPSTDQGPEDYPSDCSDRETCPEGVLEGKPLFFRYDPIPPPPEEQDHRWFLAENGFRLRREQGSTWYYVTVQEVVAGPFFGTSQSEDVQHKQSVYQIMAAQDADGQYWGEPPGAFGWAGLLPGTEE